MVLSSLEMLWGGLGNRSILIFSCLFRNDVVISYYSTGWCIFHSAGPVFTLGVFWQPPVLSCCTSLGLDGHWLYIHLCRINVCGRPFNDWTTTSIQSTVDRRPIFYFSASFLTWVVFIWKSILFHVISIMTPKGKDSNPRKQHHRSQTCRKQTRPLEMPWSTVSW